MYVERNGGNKIIGAYAQPQPDKVMGQLNDNDPELLLFLNPDTRPENIAEKNRISTFTLDPQTQDLLNRLRTATPAQIDSWLQTNVTTLAQARTVLGALVKMLVSQHVFN